MKTMNSARGSSDVSVISAKEFFALFQRTLVARHQEGSSGFHEVVFGCSTPGAVARDETLDTADGSTVDLAFAPTGKLFSISLFDLSRYPASPGDNEYPVLNWAVFQNVLQSEPGLSVKGTLRIEFSRAECTSVREIPCVSGPHLCLRLTEKGEVAAIDIAASSPAPQI